jgi:bifunctional non-homologous end joining protein LigD
VVDAVELHLALKGKTQRMTRVELTHPERMFWPEAGLRKRDLVEYYSALAPVLVRHLRGRPFTIKRHYTVPRGPFQWVKDAPPELPGWIRTCPQPAKSRGGALVRYPVVDSTDALLWLVEYGAVDLHVWTARCDRPDRADYVLFDLDPAKGAGMPETVEAALL